ncbi:MAG TPA: alanine racemase [Gemmatimonadaceae bacterium]|nr:alanine racemase [Gemmatimonadaceae bacterium]
MEIDLGALVRNAQTLADRARVPLLPMVKADAYGLGAIPVVRALESLEPWGYGVATVTEGAELRAAGIARPIVVFTPLLVSELDAARQHGLTPALGSQESIAVWRTGPNTPWHLAIDTGMNRAGVPWDAVATLDLGVCRPQGAFTHFHSAECDDGSLQLQLARFSAAIASMPERPRLLHAENSAALERLAGPSAWDIARPGVFLYGVGETAEPVATLKAHIVDLRTVAPGESVSYSGSYRATSQRRIATLALGYADGYRRAFGNRGRVIVNDQEARVVGNVTMDMTMIDVTDVPCAIGDVVTLLGRAGNRVLDAVTVAETGGVSPYELLVGLKLRAPRIYTGPTGYV